jgi:hypothetical protein
VHEDVIDQPILNFQSKTIEPGIVPIPLAGVDIVRREGDSFPQKLVVKRQQGAIEKMDLVVP